MCDRKNIPVATQAQPVSVGRLLDAAHAAVEILDMIPDDPDAQLASVELSNAAAAVTTRAQPQSFRHSEDLHENAADALTRMDALLDPAAGLLTVPDGSATVLASRADLKTIRAALAQQPDVQDREDAERMDWLDRVAHCADWLDGEPTKRVIRASDGAEFTGDTWREAIDAARAAKGE